MTKTNFDGLTETNCCDDGTKDGCVISGQFYCAHPRKGGLHSAQQQDPEALKRYRTSLAILDRNVAEAKFKRASSLLED